MTEKKKIRLRHEIIDKIVDTRGINNFQFPEYEELLRKLRQIGVPDEAIKDRLNNALVMYGKKILDKIAESPEIIIFIDLEDEPGEPKTKA